VGTGGNRPITAREAQYKNYDVGYNYPYMYNAGYGTIFIISQIKIEICFQHIAVDDQIKIIAMVGLSQADPVWPEIPQEILYITVSFFRLI
jgi:hypothetical protein